MGCRKAHRNSAFSNSIMADQVYFDMPITLASVLRKTDNTRYSKIQYALKAVIKQLRVGLDCQFCQNATPPHHFQAISRTFNPSPS